MFTTPPARKDVLKVLPELRTLQKTTIRLHPRFTNPSASASKTGSPILWPADVAWPCCPYPLSEHDDVHELFGANALAACTAVPLSPLFQFRYDQFPELGFLPRHELCQIFACLLPHKTTYRQYIYPQVFWHASIEGLLEQSVPVDCLDDRYGLRSCGFTHEEVVEYPHITELSEQQQERLTSWDVADVLDEDLDEPSTYYQFEASVCPSTKIGAYVSWTYYPKVMLCSLCGLAMEHWLTLSSLEWDGGTYARWMPLEDRWRLTGTVADRAEANQALSALISGYYVFFICRACPDLPIQTFFMK